MTQQNNDECKYCKIIYITICIAVFAIVFGYICFERAISLKAELNETQAKLAIIKSHIEDTSKSIDEYKTIIESKDERIKSVVTCEQGMKVLKQNLEEIKNGRIK